ncbi:hypothetical protein KBA41_15045 [Candidatus Ozemobacteraceae bacterium]|nr:hypothetical protein [Candidatus Ozemobacteraceae bacterium]
MKTAAAGGRFEKKVRLPEDWVRGFLHLQAAMAIPGTLLAARPVDLLAPIRFLRYTKAKVSPRALRYELNPGVPPAIALEPWEERFTLKGEEGFEVNPAKKCVMRAGGTISRRRAFQPGSRW